MKPLHGDDGVQRSPTLQQGSILQLCLLGPAPQITLPPPGRDSPGGTEANAHTAPAPQSQGQKGSPLSPDTAAKSMFCSMLPAWKVSSATWLHPCLWPSHCTGTLPPLKPVPQPLCLPPKAGGAAPNPFSAQRSAAAGQQGQACGMGMATHCMHSWEPAPCASPDGHPRESVSSDTRIFFACRVPGWAPGAASSSKACFGSGRIPRTPDAELVLHLHLDYIDRGRLLLAPQ